MEQQRRSEKFFKDFGIYSIGILGTRIITFLMVPVYTYFIEKPSDYGYYDLCLNVCMLLIPIATLQMREAALRFLLNNDKEQQRQQIVTFIYKTLLGNLLLMSLLAALATTFTHIGYLWHTFALLLSMSVYDVSCQVARGLGRNDIYVQCNIINAMLIGLLSVVFLVVFNSGIEGIFGANIISRALALLYMEIRLHICSRYFCFKIPTKDVARHILRYALPLIPATLCWLITTLSDRFFIRYFISLEMNGIYAVAIRFTMILHTMVLIFYQAWQETAITQYHSKDRDQFFSKIFNYYVFALSALLITFAFVVKMNYGWLVDHQYYEGGKFIYLMGTMIALSALSSSYFELAYQCAKETKRTILATVLTMLINISLNFVLAPRLGVYGIIITNLVSYSFLSIYRYFDTKRYFNLHIYNNSLFLIPIVLTGGFMYSLETTWVVDALVLMVLLGAIATALPAQLRTWIIAKTGDFLKR